jgi:hypothetical protein
MKAILTLKLLFISILSVSCNSKSSKNIVSNTSLFDSIKKVNSNYGQYEGSAFIGNNSGTCYMVLENGKKIGDNYEKIIRLRYQLYENVVDETFVVRDLNIMNSKTSEMRLKNPDKYAKQFIKGKFRGLKNSINNGRIADSYSSGDVVFAIDSIGKNLKYVMIGDGDYSYQGIIKLNEENHISIKKIFNENISKKEEKNIIQSYNKIELISSQLIKIKANSYKFQLSKDSIFNNGKLIYKTNQQKKNSFMGFKANENAKEEKTDFYIESIIDNLFSFKIKNISNTFDFYINDRFYGPRMSSTQEQKIIFNFSRGSSLGGDPADRKFTSNFKKGDEVNFTFNLKLSSDNVPERFKNMTMYDLMNSQDFLNILNSAFELPAFIIMTNGRDSETLAKIYFELVD